MASVITDYKPAIIEALTVLMKSDQIRKEKFKVIAYQKVLKSLAAHEGPIRSLDDLEGIEGVGTKIRAKIEEIMATGSLQAAKEAAAALPITVYDDLLKVHGIGPVKARKLVEEVGIRSIEDLRLRVAADPSILDAGQKIGLKFFEEFNERIPRPEMEQHEGALLAAKPSNMKIELVGSYRRGAASSGDIDALINFPWSKSDIDAVQKFHDYVKKLIDSGYITDILALGNHKCMAVCTIGSAPSNKLEHKHRRLDLLLTPSEEWPFAILYFTGSDRFNVAMRAHAQEQGFTMNEHTLQPLTAAARARELPQFKTERDIFNFLGLRYIKPEERTGADKVIPI
jgi:DNA polymerase beta